MEYFDAKPLVNTVIMKMIESHQIGNMASDGKWTNLYGKPLSRLLSVPDLLSFGFIIFNRNPQQEV